MLIFFLVFISLGLWLLLFSGSRNQELPTLFARSCWRSLWFTR